MIDRGFEFSRLVDLEIVYIENHVAVIGDNAFAVNRVAAKFNQLSRDVTARHGNHFDRQRECAEIRHELAFIGNAYKLFGRCCNYFFARERSPAAFNQLQMIIGFIGAVDINTQHSGGVEIDYRNANLF